LFSKKKGPVYSLVPSLEGKGKKRENDWGKKKRKRREQFFSLSRHLCRKGENKNKLRKKREASALLLPFGGGEKRGVAKGKGIQASNFTKKKKKTHGIGKKREFPQKSVSIPAIFLSSLFRGGSDLKKGRLNLRSEVFCRKKKKGKDADVGGEKAKGIAIFGCLGEEKKEREKSGILGWASAGFEAQKSVTPGKKRVRAGSDAVGKEKGPHNQGGKESEVHHFS